MAKAHSMLAFPNSHWTRFCACGLAGAALAAAQARAESPYDPNWTRNFRLGAVVGMNIKGDFKMSGDFGVVGNPPGVYDDGYVLVDDTGNAGGYTSYWGYENASQYDPGTQTLLMHSSSSFSATGSGSGKEDAAVGFELAYGGVLKRWRRSRLEWELGFGWLPIEIEDGSPASALVTRSEYAFETGGILMPTAPYNGGSSGIGPTIRTTPTLVGTDTEAASLLGSRGLDVSLYTFRLGPTLFHDLSRHVGIAVGIGGAVGIADETYEFNEAITFSDGSVSRNRGSFGQTDVVYGGYVNVTATWHVEEGGDLYFGVQYMPMSGSTLSQDGREASLDLSGQLYFSIGVNWPF
jgi:hypothetical protein